MQLLSAILLFTNMLFSVKAVDKCGGSCNSLQICANNGTCVNRSDLVKCGSWIYGYYCEKGQDCCGFDGCIPEGHVCCSNGVFYCKPSQTCCGAWHCCQSGYFCDNDRCVLDLYSTQKPSTTRPTTRYPSTEQITRYPTTERITRYPTTKSYTRYPYPTTRKSEPFTSGSGFRWWFGVIITGVVLTIAIIIALVIWNRRNSGTSVPGQAGVVLSVPSQVSRQPPPNNSVQQAGVQIHTDGQRPKQNTPFIVTRTDVPVQTQGNLPTQSMPFVISNTYAPVHTNLNPSSNNVPFKTSVPPSNHKTSGERKKETEVRSAHDLPML